MKRVAVVLVALLFVGAFIICGRAFAQKAANDPQKPVKTLAATEATIATETNEASKATETTEAAVATEATIPYSAAYNSPNTGADEVDVDEDSE